MQFRYAFATVSVIVMAMPGVHPLSAAPSAAPYAHYYVHGAHADAADANPGTEAAPFRTIRGALEALEDRLQAGDTVWIKNGTYREEIRMHGGSRPGTGPKVPSGEGYARMFSLMAYPGHAPVIKGSDVVEGWVRDEGDVWVKEGWTFNSQQVFADGEPLAQIGGVMATGFMTTAWRGRHKGKSRADLFPGSFYYDLETERLHVRLPDGRDPNTLLMEADARMALVGIAPDLDYIRISGLTLRHGSNFGHANALSVSGRYGLIERIDQAWHSFGGAHCGGEYNTFTHCRFNHNGNRGMSGSGRGHRLLFNETSYNNRRNWSTGWVAGGVKFIPGAHDWVLRGHVSAYNNGDGIWFDAWMVNVTIEECISYRNRGSGIHYEIGSRGVIKNNILYENGGRGIYLSTSSYTLIANNLVYRNGMSGIASVVATGRRGDAIFNRGETDSVPGGNNVVSGNLLVDNCNAVYLLDHLDTWPLDDSMRDYFREVIAEFVGWSGRPELIMPEQPGGNEGSFSDFNIFYRSGERGDPARLPFGRNWNVGFARGLEDWREKTGWDRNSIFARPRFMDEANYDFRPADDCPSLWFVKKVEQAVWFGMEGVRRPGWMVPVTAGPYGGTAAQFEQAQQAVASETLLLHNLARIAPANRYPLVTLLRPLMGAFDSLYVTPLEQGYVIDDVPFLLSPTRAHLLSHAATPPVTQSSIRLNWTLDTLSLLLTARGGDRQPLARLTLHRDDGFAIPLDITRDETGALAAVSGGNPVPVTRAWEGETQYWSEEANARVPYQGAVYHLAWTNDNPWLPIREIEFELLDPEAELAVLGLTGLRE